MKNSEVSPMIGLKTLVEKEILKASLELRLGEGLSPPWM